MCQRNRHRPYLDSGLPKFKQEGHHSHGIMPHTLHYIKKKDYPLPHGLTSTRARAWLSKPRMWSLDARQTRRAPKRRAVRRARIQVRASSSRLSSSFVSQSIARGEKSRELCGLCLWLPVLVFSGQWRFFGTRIARCPSRLPLACFGIPCKTKKKPEKARLFRR